MILTGNNIINYGPSGMFDNQIVFRQRYGKIIGCKAPKKRPGKGTPNQQKARQRMTEANIYARKVKLMPGWSAFYEERLYNGRCVQHLAVSDYFHPPIIHHINTGSYRGRRGGLITVNATDNFKVKQVIVTVYNELGLVVESGDAVQIFGSDNWEYTAITKCNGVCRIEVKAMDLPGNVTMQEVEVALAPAIVEGPCERPDKIRPVPPPAGHSVSVIWRTFCLTHDIPGTGPSPYPPSS